MRPRGPWFVRPTCHSDTRLDWLCSNRGGAPGDLNPGGIWNELWNFKGTPTEGRRLLLTRLTARAPSSTPGTKYEYSNAGFALAGHMLETVADNPWEALLTERFFVPLGMTSAGFGVPATPRHIDQPWGQQRVGANNNPMEPGTNADNPLAIGPAGTVHCSLLDLAKYCSGTRSSGSRPTATSPSWRCPTSPRPATPTPGRWRPTRRSAG